MKRHFLVKAIAVVLSVLMASLCGIQALAEAANQPTEYISEMRVASNSNADEAKKELTDLGYIVIDNDVNQGTGKDAVYIGYKTTKNSADAITDIRVMDMNGGYSVQDYNDMLKEYEEKVTKELNGYKSSIKEFRELYLDQDAKAVYAYKQLNRFKEDDSGKLIGDLFIEQEPDMATLTKVFVQGNPESIKAIEQIFAVVFSDEFLQSTVDNMSNDYSGSTDLDETCAIIIQSWTDLQQGLYKYYSQLEASDGYDMSKYTEESFKEFKSKNSQQADEVYLYGCFYEYLLSYKTADGNSLLQLFLKSKEDLTYNDLYPLADALTTGAVQAMKYVGLQYTVSLNDCDIEKTEQYQNEHKQEIESVAVDYANSQTTCEQEKITTADLDTVISVYAGIDRTIYDKNGGIAITTDALRKSTTTADTVGRCITRQDGFYLTVAASCVLSAVGIGSIVAAFQTAKSILREGFNMTVYTTGRFIGTVAVGAFFIASALVMVGAMVGTGVKEYYHPKYTVVPRVLVDEVSVTRKNLQGSEVTEKNYFAYYAAFDTEDTGSGNRKYGDLNGWQAHQWNALYYTKDKRAGNPITADFVIQLGNETAPTGYTPVRYFGSNQTAFNLNTHSFTACSGIYMFYNSTAGNSTIGSSFTVGYVAISAVAGIIVGGLLTALVLKKKKKTVTED